MVISFFKLDRLFGSPIKRVILYIEKKLLKRINEIHLISAEMPEEDEAVLLWSLNSLYLNFFYPDSHFFDKYLLFDDALSHRRRRNLMMKYKRYLQRHNYVFNRKGERTFLSKNPLMMCKLESLQDTFNDARIININRCPAHVIPSTINLNNTIYSFFTSIKSRDEVNKRTTDILISWYKMAYNAIETKYGKNCIKLDFTKLVIGDRETDSLLSKFLQIDLHPISKDNNKKHKSKQAYEGIDERTRLLVENELPFMKPYCN